MPIVIDRIDLRAALTKDGDQRRVAPLRRVVQSRRPAFVRFCGDARVGSQDLYGTLVVLQECAASEVWYAATGPHRAHRIGISAGPPRVAVQGHLSEMCVGVGGCHATPIRRLDNSEHMVRVAALDGRCEPGCYVGHRLDIRP